MAGFFKAADIAAFTTQLAVAFSKLRCGPNQHLTLVDIRNMDIQSQDSVSGFAGLLHNSGHASKRIAFLVSRSLARLQIQRAAEGRDARYFMDRQEAEDWLIDARPERRIAAIPFDTQDAADAA